MRSLQYDKDVEVNIAKITIVTEAIFFISSILYFLYEARQYDSKESFENEQQNLSAGVDGGSDYPYIHDLRTKEVKNKFEKISILSSISQALSGILGLTSLGACLIYNDDIQRLLIAIEAILWLGTLYMLRCMHLYQKNIYDIRYKLFLKSKSLENLYPMLIIYVLYKYQSFGSMGTLEHGIMYRTPLAILCILGTGMIVISSISSVLLRNLNICTRYSSKDIEKARDPNKRSLISKATFAWITPSINKGIFKRIDLDDFPDIPPKYRSENVSIEITRTLNISENLLILLLIVIWKDLLVQILYSLVSCVLFILGPYLFNKILVVVTGSSPDSGSILTTFLLSFSLLATRLLSAVVSAHMYYVGAQISLTVKLALLNLVYKKVALIKSGASSVTRDYAATTRASVGASMTNILATDIQQISTCSRYIVYLLIMPIRVFSVTWLLLRTVGSASMVGLLVMLVCYFISTAISFIVPRAQKSYLKATDHRVTVTNEIFNSIRGIKITSKEKYFTDAVQKLRKSEIKMLVKRVALNIILYTMSNVSVVTTPLMIIYTYVFIKKMNLTPSVAFTVLALVKSLNDHLLMFFDYSFSCVSVMVNFRRLRKFMDEYEVESYVTNSNISFDNDTNTESSIPFVGLSSDATLSWKKPNVRERKSKCGSNKEEATTALLLQNEHTEADLQTTSDNSFVLKNLNIRFPKGMFTLVTGKTGSGKSSLLSSLLGEMHLISGKVYMPFRKKINPGKVYGIDQRLNNIGDIDVAYFSQNSWLINSSIKNNIVFNSEWDSTRYNAVLHSCSLNYYLDNMPERDETIVGDFGMKLSGGQRLCVALARAAYSNSSVVLLDDPLSALDPKFLKHTIEICLLEFLKGRTLIMAANMVESYYKYADYIVVMDNGNVKFQGYRDEFINTNTSETVSTISTLQDIHGFEEGVQNSVITSILASKGTQSDISQSPYTNMLTTTAYSDESTPLIIRSLSPGYKDSKLNQSNTVEMNVNGLTNNQTEKSSHGRIELHTYITYINAIGGFRWLSVLIGMFVIIHVLGVAQIFVLKSWTTAREVSLSNSNFLKLYASMGFTLIVLRFIQMLFVFVCSLRSSLRIHLKTIESLLNTSARFFDTTSIGQIMNRLFQDLQNIDHAILPIVSSFIESVILALSSLIIIVYSIPLFLPSLLPVYHMYHCISKTYISSSIEIQRLEKVTQSNMYSFFKQSLDGVREIRSFNAFKFFHKEVCKILDVNLKAYHYVWTINRWLAVRTDSMDAFVVFTATMGITVMYSLGILDGGSAGVALGYSIVFSDSTLFTIRHRVHLEVSMSSMERIEDYMNLERELSVIGVAADVPQNWPSGGRIEVKNIYATYSPNNEKSSFVLRNLNFNIDPGQKIAIMGHTGSGKSTFLSLLLRLMNPYSGSILIDSIDIAHIDLETLRSRITTVTQHPLVFAGTVRNNIDPSNQASDEEIEDALAKLGLTGDNNDPSGEHDGYKTGPKVSSPYQGSVHHHMQSIQKISLDSWIEEGGANLSQGQKQLICIASAIIRKSRLIILDEITSSTDSGTSEHINNLILRIFADSTVICVSHRIKTALEYDKIILFHHGEMAESGSPYDLLSKKSQEYRGNTPSSDDVSDGIFRSICMECGNFDECLNIAKKNYNMKNRRV